MIERPTAKRSLQINDDGIISAECVLQLIMPCVYEGVNGVRIDSCVRGEGQLIQFSIGVLVQAINTNPPIPLAASLGLT